MLDHHQHEDRLEDWKRIFPFENQTRFYMRLTLSQKSANELNALAQVDGIPAESPLEIWMSYFKLAPILISFIELAGESSRSCRSGDPNLHFYA